MVRCKNCGVRQLALFTDMTDDDFKLVHQPVDEIKLAKGKVLYHTGDRANCLYTLRSGLIKMTHYLVDGSQRVVRLVRPGGTMGLEALVSGSFAHNAEALQDSVLCRIPVSVVETLDRESPRLHKQILTRWHQTVMDADYWLTQMCTGSARERVARLCLFLADDDSDMVACHLPGREDIGAMLGITTETASRVIADFRRQGLLTTHSRREFSMNVDSMRLLAGIEDCAA
ncbi:Crp/Fnr family transcriptional regulator [Thalassospira mesophila]|uniref:Crp/Fnr family transcriptional regulator n=2 Tax=Thalassospira mesophila TaxID=1293891 RepID=A0A1Y2L851_9PROT|nr:Crp/Fnr family transcriptional regulator [Thalassospira mesophila]